MSSSSKCVALTGGIGCGKTTVLLEFQRLGIPCFVADQEAKKLYSLPHFVRHVAKRLGPSVINPDGSANRQAIAGIVFNDPDALAWLNEQVHPFVMTLFEQWCGMHQDAPYVIFECAILYESHLEERFDKVVCVYLNREERLRRLAYRDHATREDLEARMANQLSAEEKMARADYVILNYEGNPRRRQVQHIHRMLLHSCSN